MNKFKDKWENVKESYFKREKRLYFENRLFIPQGNLRNSIVHDNNESLLEGHSGETKTFTLVQRHFYWQTQRNDIKSTSIHAEDVKSPNLLTKES